MKLIRIQRNGAFAVIAVLIAVVVLSAFVAVAFSYTSNNGRMAHRSRQFTAAEGVAEGGLEVLFAKWRAAGRAAVQTNQGLPSPSEITSMTGANNAPSGTNYPDFAGYTFSGYTLTPVDQFNVTVTGNPPPSNPVPVAGRPGWVARTTNYRAEARVTAPARGGIVSNKVTRRFQKADAPIFQAAIFYEMDLEIHPSPELAITGLVHTNSNLYAAGDPGAIIFNRNVSYTGQYKEGFAPGDPRTAYTAPTFAYGMESQLNQVGRLEPLGNEPNNIFNTTDTNTNNDSFRELIERPNTAQSDPAEIAPLRFYSQAGLRVLVDTSLATTDANRVKIYNGRGLQLTSSGGTNVVSLIAAVKAAISSGETIKDNREANNVLLTTFDLSKLTTITTAMSLLAAPTTSNTTSQAVNTYNGILYITDVSANATGGTSNVNGSSATQAEKAIRLKNGASIPSNLSIASENAVYIQGDFNTGGTGTAVPSNNTTTASPSTAFLQPNVTGYDRKACAVLGDSVNILSSAWVDTNSTNSSDSRVAVNTTINTAILSGIIPTNLGGNARYSGGAENFPRFSENWANKNFCYYGSMVSFFISKQANGAWGNTNVYSPPLRRWFFDSNFIQNPPPGTLHSFTYSRGRWARN